MLSLIDSSWCSRCAGGKVPQYHSVDRRELAAGLTIHIKTTPLAHTLTHTVHRLIFHASTQIWSQPWRRLCTDKRYCNVVLFWCSCAINILNIKTYWEKKREKERLQFLKDVLATWTFFNRTWQQGYKSQMVSRTFLILIALTSSFYAAAKVAGPELKVRFYLASIMSSTFGAFGREALKFYASIRSMIRLRA